MTPDLLTPSLEETLALFDGSGVPLTTTEAASRLELGRRSTYDRLRRLVDADRLETKKVGASARVWWRPPESAPLDRRCDALTETGVPPEQSVDGEIGVFALGENSEVAWANGIAERYVAPAGGDVERERAEVFARISDAFFALDGEWRFTHVNDQAATVLDRRTDDLLGESLWEVFPAAVGSRFQERYERARETGETVTFEEYYPPLDAWFEVAAYPSPSGLSVYFRDVTDRKKRETELERYETLVETVEDGLYAVDADARFVMVNDRFCDLTGYARDELLGAHAATIHDEEITPRAETLAREILDGERDVGVVELDVRTKTGERIPSECRLAPFPLDGGSFGRCGVVRDISDRLDAERELRRRVRQQEAVASLGQRALDDRDVDALMARAAELVADVLGTDYCEVLDLDGDAGELLVRQGVGWNDGIVGSATVSAVDDGSQAAHTLRHERPIVVSDLATESRFDGPALLTSHGVRSGVSTIIGPYDEPWGILGAHDTARREFSEQDVTFVRSVATVLASAIARHDDERELVRQRTQLAALNSLNGIVQRIGEAIIDQSSREEIERAVCDRLAESDSYLFAWIGEADTTSRTVALRVEAGVEGYLDGATISIDHDDQRSEGPTGRALRTGTVQTAADVRFDDRFDPWREHVETHAFRSSAAIPIVSEGTVYGVLNVYSDRPDAFEGQERAVVGRLGEIVGHAIAAIERKQALMSDDAIELVFEISDVSGTFGVDGGIDGKISMEYAAPVENDAYLVYGTATVDAVDGLHALVDAIPRWEEVTVREDRGGDARFELRIAEPPMLSTIASVGGSVATATIEDGDYRMTVHIAPSLDVRRIVDTVTEAYPTAQLLKRRRIERRTDAPECFRHELLDDLTDRQRTVLELAYHAGFFEWPRDTSGEAVAASIGIAPATFHQHLRIAELKVFDRIISASGTALA